MKIYTWIFLILALQSTTLRAEFSGHFALEGRGFPTNADGEKQKRAFTAAIMEPEYYKSFKEDKLSFTIRPYVILDQHDEERNHFDLRELNLMAVGSWWEWKLGISRVFWGVTEFSHLANIINQTDFVSDINEDEKLGQPMNHISLISDYGVLEAFVLFGFRERTFPGEEGRFLYGMSVDTDAVEYESDEEEKHLDYALRYSHSMGIFDLGLSFFKGTGRDPLLKVSNDGASWVPYYEQISQASLDLQASQGDILWKLEGIYRDGREEDYLALSGGLEYTLVGFLDSAADLGVIVEYMYDERGDHASTPFANDVFLGLRLAANDTGDLQVLMGYGQDLNKSSNLVSMELSRRLSNHLKIAIDARIFLKSADDQLAIWLKDDFVRLNLSYFF